MSLWQHHQSSDQSSWEGLGDTVKPRAQRHREECRSGLVGGAASRARGQWGLTSTEPLDLLTRTWILFWTRFLPWNCPGQNTGVGSLCLLQRIFPSQGSNPGPLHCRWILHQLSKKGRTSANSLKSGVVNQHMRISNTPVGSRLSPQSFKYLILVSV